MSGSSHETDFSSLMETEGVAPIQQAEKVKRAELTRADNRDKSALASLRKHAESFEEIADDPLSGVPEELVKPLSEISYIKPGIQQGVYKKLRLGKYPLEARLDLHRLTVDKARVALVQFIRDCVDNELRTVLITHGKGEGRERPALLKSCINHWLPQMDEVLAFHTAQKQHGSYGASYVLLRKSPKEKLRNRAQYN